MFPLILVETFCPHSPIEQSETHQQIECSVTNVIKLVPFNLTGSHQLFSGGPFQDLDARFFIQGDHNDALLPQPSDSLVIPKDFQGSGDGQRVPDRRLPIAKSMGLEMACSQDVVNRRMINARDEVLFDGCLFQAPRRPAQDIPADTERLLARQVLNLRSHPRGEKRAGGPSVVHHTARFPSRLDDTVHTPATQLKNFGQPYQPLG